MGAGSYIHHFNAIRSRLVGSGSFKVTFESLDETATLDVAPITMSATTNRYENQLTNFKQERARVYFRVTDINEYFTLKSLIIFSKPLRTGYPQ